MSQTELDNALYRSVKALPKFDKENIPAAFQIISLLLAAGARIPKFSNGFTWTGNIFSATLYHECCFYGNLPVLQQLQELVTNHEWNQALSVMYSILACTVRPYTPLCFAILNENIECAEFLFPFYFQMDNLKVIQRQIIDVIERKYGYANYNIVNMMLQQCGDKGMLDMYGNMLHAVFSNKLPMVAILIANHHTWSESEFAQLADTVFNRHSRHFVELLFNHYADITIPEIPVNNLFSQRRQEEGWAMLCHHAQKSPKHLLTEMLVKVVQQSYDSCMQYILQDEFRQYLDLNAQYEGETALTTTLKYWRFDVIEILLNYDIDTNQANEKGESPMYLLLCGLIRIGLSGGYGCFQSFIRYGCDVNIRFPEVQLQKPRWANALSAAVHEYQGRQLPGLLETIILAGGYASNIAPYTVDIKRTPAHDRCLCLINQALMEPRSLKHMTRLCIRFALSTNIPGKLTGLTGFLPTALKEYLLLPEINDIEIDDYLQKTTLAVGHDSMNEHANEV